MLTSQVRGTIRPRSLSSPTLPTIHAQSRTFFGWRRRSTNWESQLDPIYTRVNRYRALKTRRNYLQTLRRRSRFDWDVQAKPFLTPKYVRWASHWNGKTSWDESADPKKDAKENSGEDVELSQREKAWKDRMETMRKRIDGDPYEAVFGKRFEPFWSPLVPSWMREEMGLPEAAVKKQPQDIVEVKGKNREPEPAKTVKKPAKEPKQVSNWYAQSSSTSWNSETDKTRTTQWDSVSNKTRSFEYDPVSGRMVPISSPEEAKSNQSKALAKAASPFLEKDKTDSKAVTADRNGAVEIPVKTLQHSGDANPTRDLPQKPPSEVRASAKDGQAKEENLESLTANDVRSSMGKIKKQDQIVDEQPSPRLVERKLAKAQQSLRQRHHETSDAQKIANDLESFNSSFERLRSQIAGIADTAATAPFVEHLQTSLERGAEAPKAKKDAPLQPAVQRMQTKAQPEPSELDDSAAHESTEPVPITSTLPKAWDQQAELLQADRVKRTTSKRPYPTARWLDDMNARKAKYDAKKAVEKNIKDAADFEKNAKLEKANAMLQAEIQDQKVAMREHGERYAHKIKDLRSELEVAYKQSSVHADEFQDRISKLTAQRPTSDQTQGESRNTRKIKMLREELDRAYKQSSVHADEFTKRIKSMQAEIDRLKAAATGVSTTSAPKDGGLKSMQGEGDFCTNITQWADSEKWYKQPASTPRDAMKAVEQAEQKARDRELVREVRGIYEKAYGLIEAQHIQPKQSKEQKKLDKALGGYEKSRTGCYAYKDDGLENELCGQKEEPAKTPEKFKSDGLEAELQKLAKQETEYASDMYEAASKQKSVPQAVAKPIAADFVAKKRTMSELEAELKRQAQEGPQYASDEYAAEAEGHGRSVPEVKAKPAVPFKHDGLEAELKQQSRQKHVYASDGYNPITAAGYELPKFLNKGSGLEALQAELIARSKQTPEYASDQYEAAAASDTTGRLEAELRAQAKQKPEYASDQYEAETSYRPSERSTVTLHKGGQEAEQLKQASQEPQYASDQYAAATGERTNSVAEFKPDDLAAELKQKAEQAPEYASDEYEAAAARAKTQLDSSANMETASPSLEGSAVQWQDPPLYKVLAYDAGNDRFSTATTTTYGSASTEEPLSISKALSELFDPAKFLPQFAKLQGEGYQVVSTSKDVLVFRKVQGGEKVQTPKVDAQASTAEQTQQVQSPRNPVDGMAKPSWDTVRPATGNFASPTGFVNYDDADPSPAAQTSTTNKSAQQPSAEAESEDEPLYRHYPRVNREEPVFSGTRRIYHNRRRWAERPRLDQEASSSSKQESHLGRRRRSGLRWVLGTGAAVGGGMYLLGSVAEKQRERQLRMRERVLGLGKQQEQMGGAQGRWGLDEGAWRGGR